MGGGGGVRCCNTASKPFVMAGVDSGLVGNFIIIITIIIIIIANKPIVDSGLIIIIIIREITMTFPLLIFPLPIISIYKSSSRFFAVQGCCLHNHCLSHRGNDDNPCLCQIRMVPCPFQKQHGM